MIRSSSVERRVFSRAMSAMTMRRSRGSSRCLDKGQMSGQFSQPLVGFDARRIDRRRAGGDEDCIELVVLGPAQVQARIGPDLDRLQDKDDEALLPQMPDYPALIASRRFDADTPDAGLGQVGRQPPPAARCIIDLPAFSPTVNRDVELAFEASIPAVVVLVCVIFVDPAL
jgi:hypothetical protein